MSKLPRLESGQLFDGATTDLFFVSAYPGGTFGADIGGGVCVQMLVIDDLSINLLAPSRLHRERQNDR